MPGAFGTPKTDCPKKRFKRSRRHAIGFYGSGHRVAWFVSMGRNLSFSIVTARPLSVKAAYSAYSLRAMARFGSEPKAEVLSAIETGVFDDGQKPMVSQTAIYARSGKTIRAIFGLEPTMGYSGFTTEESIAAMGLTAFRSVPSTPSMRIAS